VESCIYGVDLNPLAVLPLGRVLFRSATVLRPHFAAVGELYPELADFFCNRLGLAKDEEIIHYARFLKEYVWIGEPSMTDALRDAVVSCYRRLLHYLAEHGGGRCRKHSQKIGFSSW